MPEVADAPEHILTVYDDSGVRTRIIAGAFVLALAGVFFLGFLANLCSVMRAAEGGTGPMPTLALAGGVSFVAMTFASGALLTVLPLLMSFDEVSAHVDPDLAAVVVQLGYLLLLLIFGLFAASVLVLATSVIAGRTALLPRWLARSGFVLAPLLLLGFAGPPLFLLLLWVVAVSIFLRPRRALVD